MSDLAYELDSEDRIRCVDGGWLAFARENGSPELAEDRVLGTSIWDWVAGLEVRHLYRLVFDRVRKQGGSFCFPFRCDSPGMRRRMELRVSALPAGALRCTSRLLDAKRRPAVALLDPGEPRSGALLGLCSWCLSVRAEPGSWLELEEAIQAMGLLEAETPGISHTICPRCESLVP